MNYWAKADFSHQFHLNQQELKRKSYPSHWVFLLESINFIKQDLNGKYARILDIGCGSGGTARFLNETVSDIFYDGLDIGPEAIKIASSHNSNPNFNFTCQSIDEYLRYAEYFDFNILLQSATVEVMENGPEIFAKLLDLRLPYVISTRMRITDNGEKSHTIQESAYGIQTLLWKNNKDELIELIQSKNYDILKQELPNEAGMNFLLKLK